MTSEAPKEIWAFYAPEIEEDNPQCTIVAGDKVMHGAQRYVRADHALAMVSAERVKALREAAELMQPPSYVDAGFAGYWSGVHEYRSKILALIKKETGQ